MPLYRAQRHITHGHAVCPVGTVIELDADEPKSDGFVLVEQPRSALPVSPPTIDPLPDPDPLPIVDDEPAPIETPRRGRRRHVED